MIIEVEIKVEVVEIVVVMVEMEIIIQVIITTMPIILAIKIALTMETLEIMEPQIIPIILNPKTKLPIKIHHNDK